MRSFQDNLSFRIVEESASGSDKYSMLATACQSMSFYVPIDLVDFQPSDAIERRKWIQNLQLPFPYRIFN